MDQLAWTLVTKLRSSGCLMMAVSFQNHLVVQCWYRKWFDTGNCLFLCSDSQVLLGSSFLFCLCSSDRHRLIPKPIANDLLPSPSISKRCSVGLVSTHPGCTRGKVWPICIGRNQRHSGHSGKGFVKVEPSLELGPFLKFSFSSSTHLPPRQLGNTGKPESIWG